MFNRIRNLREDNDFKQSDIANQLGLSQPQYQRYESGKRQIPIDILIQLSKIYDVSVDYLLGLSNSKKALISVSTEENKLKFQLTDDDTYLLEIFHDLEPDDKRIVLGKALDLRRATGTTAIRKKDIG